MKKTKIIREIIGTRIEPYGFIYLETDGPCRIFVREVTGIKRYYDPDNQVVKQYINIQDGPFPQEIYARLRTDIYGHEGDEDIAQIRKYSKTGYLKYTDEDSFREQLYLIGDLIIKYGLKYLNEISIEEEEIPTKAMAEKVFQQHTQLDREFIDEYHIKRVPDRGEDIDEWIRLIKQLIADNAERPYEEVKELLVKIAAFIGERECEILGKEWYFPEHIKFPRVVGGLAAISPLELVVDMWNARYDESKMKKAVMDLIINELKKRMINKK